MPSRALYYRLPGTTDVVGPIESDALWREVHEGRVNPATVVADAPNGLFVPFTALPNDAFSDATVLEMESVAAHAGDAEQLHLKALFKLHAIQAHLKVYGSRSAENVTDAQDALEFVDAALKLAPRNANYINTKALLLSDGLGLTEPAQKLLEEAAAIAPQDIQIQQNLRDLRARAEGCLGVLVLGLAVSLGAAWTVGGAL